MDCVKTIMKRGRLIITLKSDLCAGSGYAYAGIIDSDVCYDGYGLPYIPAKRIKGVLREAAELIGMSKECSTLFGERGLEGVKGVYLGNAYMAEGEILQKELAEIKEKLPDHPFHAQNVLEQFTTVKSQTRIGADGTAVDNSLRFTRTVNHYAPWSEGEGKEEEMQFVAEVHYYEEADSNCIKNLLTKAAKALRNMGLNRNRGLGSVTCSFQPSSSQNDRENKIAQEESVLDEKTDYILEYTVENTAPLMLSSDNDSVSEKYISGQSVLGYFAGAYLRTGKDGDSLEFQDLFLKNQVIFSNLYPVKEDMICYPAPSYINKMKKTEELVNVSKKSDMIQEKSKGGNQPKKLKGKFVGKDNSGKYQVHEVSSEIVFHHAKSGGKSREQGKKDAAEGQLYTFQVISPGQKFRGEIRGKGAYIALLKELLENDSIRFGKSKSAQYGSCRLLGGHVEKAFQKEERQKASMTFKKGTRILAVLQSDGIFLDEKYGYTVRRDEVRRQIREALGIQENPVWTENEDGERPYLEIEVKELTGYYGKWNLKRQAIPVVAAGSTFEYILEEALTVTKTTVGERIGEGYGQLTVQENVDFSQCVKDEPEKKENKTEKLLGAKKEVLALIRDGKDNRLKILCRRILESEIKKKLNADALSKGKEERRLNSAALGRVTLMLTESVSQYPSSSKTAYRAFRKRINTIKTDDTRDKANALVNQYICDTVSDKEETQEELTVMMYQSMLEASNTERNYCEWYREIFGEDAYQTMLKDCWADYMLLILTGMKYRLKNDERNNKEE